MKKEKVTFEEALNRLEHSVERLEDDSISLDEAITEFETGVGAIKEARALLSDAEGRVVKILEGENGEVIEKLLNIDISTLTGGREE